MNSWINIRIVVCRIMKLVILITIWYCRTKFICVWYFLFSVNGAFHLKEACTFNSCSFCFLPWTSPIFCAFLFWRALIYWYKKNPSNYSNILQDSAKTRASEEEGNSYKQEIECMLWFTGAEYCLNHVIYAPAFPDHLICQGSILKILVLICLLFLKKKFG